MTTRSLVCLFVVFLALAVGPLACKDGGCGGSNGASNAGASASQAVTTASASASASARPRGFGVRMMGPGGPLFRAASTLDLKPEQRTALEKVAADLREAEKGSAEVDGGARAEMKAMHDDLVLGVKSGKLETAKLDAHLAVMERASKARQEREATAIDRLHATLEPAQRTALVAAVREAETQRANRMKARERPDAGARAGFARARLEGYTKDLGLEPDQQKKVQSFLPKDEPKEDPREEARKRSESLLVSFDKDTFDAKSELTQDPKKVMQPMSDMVKFLGQLVPLLTPIQRDKLAAKVDRGPGAEGGGRPPRMRGRDGDDDDDGAE